MLIIDIVKVSQNNWEEIVFSKNVHEKGAFHNKYLYCSFTFYILPAALKLIQVRESF